MILKDFHEDRILRPGKLSALTKMLEDYADYSRIPVQSISNLNYFKFDEIKSDLLNLNILNRQNKSIDLSINPEFLDNKLNMDERIIFWFAKKYEPKWLNKFKKGLVSVRDLRNTDNEIYQCLNNCGLFKDNYSGQLNQHLTALSYSLDEEKTFEDYLHLLEIGRRGEELSYEYEKNNPNVKYLKKAYIENNDLGYDLEIHLENNKRFIEVKSSNMGIDKATASITRNQINAALETEKYTNNNFYFHFWAFHNDQKKLAVIPIDKIKNYLHIEKPGTRLPTQEINFNNFSSLFKRVK